MSIDVRPSQDAEKFLATDQLVWFGEATDSDPALLRLGLPEDQRFVVDLPDGPEELHSGIYGVRPMEMSLPGGAVMPIAGLTWVGVHPDSRRRGVLAAMMTDHLSRSHDAGSAISALHASEPGIYGRFGYGTAVLTHQVSLGRGTTFTAPQLEDEVSGITTHVATMSHPGVAERMRACQRAHAGDFPGTVIGSSDFFSLMSTEPPEALRDKERRRVLFARRDGEDVGFVGMRREHKWDKARPSGTVTAGVLCGGPAARLALARRLVDLDLMGSTKLENIGVDDPLLGWVGGPRGTGDLQTWDSTWIRLVDVDAAWALRSFEGDCDVVVEVEDRYAPWNAGRWRLSASSGEGKATRADEDADLTLDVNVLGAGFLGHGIGGRLRAGLVREHRTGAYAELARAMRTLVGAGAVDRVLSAGFGVYPAMVKAPRPLRGPTWLAPLALVVAGAVAGALRGELKDLLVYQYAGGAVMDHLSPYSRDDPNTGLPFTYPPFAAVLMVPLALLPAWLAAALWTGASAGALGGSVVVVRRALGRTSPSWLVVLLVVAALALEPVWQNVVFGQVNLLLMLAVLVDLLRPERRLSGVALGIAAGVKLTPLVFVVLLVLTGHRAAAARAVIAFASTVAVGFAAVPGSAAYWTDRLVDPSRVGPPALAHNQSVYGALTRVLDSAPSPHLWLVAAAPLAFAVLLVAAMWWSRGDRVLGTCLGAMAMLLASPVAWSHHWVWVVPVALVLWEHHRWAAAAWAAVFVSRPILWPPWGEGREFAWGAAEHLVGNAYLLAALALAAWAASVTRASHCRNEAVVS